MHQQAGQEAQDATARQEAELPRRWREERQSNNQPDERPESGATRGDDAKATTQKRRRKSDDAKVTTQKRRRKGDDAKAATTTT
jgi:hypothetical protein